MIISEAIKKLQEIQAEHGDLDVGMENVEFAGTFFPVTVIEVRQLKQTGDYFTDDESCLNDPFVGIS